MKHGRPHKVLKEQAYKARGQNHAEGYTTPFRPLEMAEKDDTWKADAPEVDGEAALTLAAALPRKSKRLLKNHVGVDPDDDR